MHEDNATIKLRLNQLGLAIIIYINLNHPFHSILMHLDVQCSIIGPKVRKSQHYSLAYKSLEASKWTGPKERKST